MTSAFGHGFDTRHLHHKTHENHNFGFRGFVLCYNWYCKQVIGNVVKILG